MRFGCVRLNHTWIAYARRGGASPYHAGLSVELNIHHLPLNFHLSPFTHVTKTQTNKTMTSKPAR